MTKLTTHVLDTYSGKPGRNIKVELYSISNKRNRIASVVLNEDGEYELIFYVGDYFKKITDLPQPHFLNEVVIRFGISNPKENYHIPLLVSPWSYSTYKGS